jgi:MFS family permease
MLTVVVPLYAVAVGLNAAEIGLIVAARSVLPSALSIHGGILMDELGTRRVLLWVAIIGALLPLLYPLAGWFSLLALLQLLLGLAASLGMAASQTWSMQVSGGATAQLARYSIATRIGTFAGPVLIGAAWDLSGAWSAFVCISLCGIGTTAATLLSRPAAHGVHHRPSLQVLVPRWAPHRQALLLALIPAVGFILAASFLRNASGAIQSSLYVVYLNSIGVSGTLIGVLVAIAEVSGVMGSLYAARVQRHMRSDTLVIACVTTSLIAIGLTPLIGASLVLLIAACVVRGIGQGMSQPLMYAVLSIEVPNNRHGASVGLRNAVVRLASIITPAVMGWIAEAYSVATSFYVICGLFLIAAVALAIAMRRLHPQ